MENSFKEGFWKEQDDVDIDIRVPEFNSLNWILYAVLILLSFIFTVMFGVSIYLGYDNVDYFIISAGVTLLIVVVTFLKVKIWK